MHRKIGILLTALLLLASTGFCIYEQQRNKPAGLIRLHIIANSNTFYDQNLKYQVRDRIVREMAPAFSEASDIETARQVADANVENIRSIAEDEIKRRGFDYPVQVVRGDYYFPAKKYTVQEESRLASFTLPPGRYEAVRVIIGSGEGANWWCVLYPPLCFVDLQQAAPPLIMPVASAAQEESIEHDEEGMEHGEEGMEHDMEEVNKKVEEDSPKPYISYRFRIMEVFKKTLNFL
ncbi:stage II sporulation protein R [Desulfallas thermosapovorans]|uniref:Stage II sporulation protein R n=1 Tax=Desulfallas thermosapovorans DSM 6562 TaxID=1121431 RepID=A0A5S4ZVY2_9FIRM|nr:stage II sporulation protein R [Desulfallas thermosapovorans]TYO96956.1 stage II sporulation protein R [Desulfallas thermosapovorans DSM 6562]